MALLPHKDNDIIFTFYVDDNELTDKYIIDERLFLINYAELKEKLNNINEKSKIYYEVMNKINEIKKQKQLSELDDFEIEIDIGYAADAKLVYFVNREHVLAVLSGLFNLDIRECPECGFSKRYADEYEIIENDIYATANDEDETIIEFYEDFNDYRDDYVEFYYDQMSYHESFDKVYIEIPIEKSIL